MAALPPLPGVELPRAAASPVNTFVTPHSPEGASANMDALARSLAGFGQQVGGLAQETRLLDNMKDREAFSLKGKVSTAASWKEAVEKGEVPYGASPVAQQAWEENRGKVIAQKWALEAHTAWFDPANPDRQHDDANSIQAWIKGRMDDALKGMSPGMQRGFMAQAPGYSAQLASQVISERDQRVQQESVADLSQLMMSRLEAAQRGQMSYAEALAGLQHDALGVRFAGMSGDTINAATAQAIIAVADKTHDPHVLDAAYLSRPDVTKPGQSIPGVAAIPKFTPHIEAARERLLSRQFRDEQRAFMLQQRQEAMVKRQAGLDLGKTIQEQLSAAGSDGTIDVVHTPAFQKLLLVDPTAASGYLSLGKALTETTHEMPPEDYGKMLVALQREPNPKQAFSEFLASGGFHGTGKDLQNMLREVDRLHATADVLGNPIFKASLGGVDAAFRNGFNAFEKPSIALAVQTAKDGMTSEVRAFVADYQQAHNNQMPPADALAKVAEAARIKATEWVQKTVDGGYDTSVLLRLPYGTTPTPPPKDTPAKPEAAPAAAPKTGPTQAIPGQGQTYGGVPAPPAPAPAQAAQVELPIPYVSALKAGMPGSWSLGAATAGSFNVRDPAALKAMTAPLTKDIPYAPKVAADGTVLIPDDSDLSALLALLKHGGPTVEATIRRFDAQFGDGATAYYVNEYNKTH